jgi:hypothetical protein
MHIYFSYPILNASEPSYVAPVIKEFEGRAFYRPFIPLYKQEKILNNLFKLKSLIINKENEKFLDRVEKLESIPFLSHLYNEIPNIPDNVEFSDLAITYDSNSQLSVNLVSKSVLILLCSNLLVLDCNTTDFGERSFESFLANFLEIPIIAVSDRFLNSPWLHCVATQLVKSTDLASTLKNILQIA